MKTFIVHIRQHFEDKFINAVDKDEAEDYVRNNTGWGEPIDIEIVAEETSVNTGGVNIIDIEIAAEEEK